MIAITPMQRDIDADTHARRMRLGFQPTPPKLVVIPVRPTPKPRTEWEKAHRPYTQTSREIIAQEIDRAEITEDEFYSDCRVHRLSHARHLAAYRIHAHTDLSLPKIAQRVGYTNHTTVMYALAKVERTGFCDEVKAERQARFDALPRRADFDEIVRVGYANAIPIRDIAKRAGKSFSAVAGRASRMGLVHPVAKNDAEHKKRLSAAHKASWAARKALEAVQA